MTNTSADRRSQFFELSLDMMAIAGANGVFREVNGVWERALGFTTNELLSRPFQEFIHPADRLTVMTAFHKNLRGVPTSVLACRLLCKDGSLRWIELSAAADAEAGLVFATARDVTEKKQMELAIRESESRYKYLVETARDFIWSVDTEGRFTFVNQAVQTIYGYTPEELIGRPFTELAVGPEQLAKDLDAFASVLRGEPLLRFETVHRRKDGQLVFMVYNAMVFYDDDGQIRGTTGTASDLTERKRAEERLRAQAEEIRAMATPLIQVWKGVVAMPIVGLVDSQRAAHIMDTLLQEVVRTRARFAILDLTGVNIVDTSTANHLLQMVRAVALIGARCVVSGISPAIAHTMVGLGIDMADLLTFRSLQTALQYALVDPDARDRGRLDGEHFE